MKKITSILFFPFSWSFKKISDAFYALGVLLNSIIRKRWPKKPSTLSKDKIKDYIYYSCLMAIPLAMFVIVNFVINGQALLLGFQEYNEVTDEFMTYGLKNFRDLFEHLGQPQIVDMFKRSLLWWGLSEVICMIIPITFSFYVYKKFFGHNVFKVLLFLPSVFSSMITVSLFKNICNQVIPEVFGCEALLTLHSKTLFDTLIFYNLWTALGGGLLMQLALMNAIDPSISESAQIDGVGFYGELWHIVLTSIYRVWILGIITSFAGIFGSTLNLFSFVGLAQPSDATLIGHHFYVETLEAKLTGEYAFLSAWGLLITAICTPLTLTLRYLFNKYGPSED